ncbi:PAS domain-containing sensor histidine kinase [Limibacter armeniacum]|uniref:PAS domain-containing sensor histidine kinase n=1 Tax=Limibacter armeniacum TaxID=466084 RepID=UPI002FE6115C
MDNEMWTFVDGYEVIMSISSSMILAAGVYKNFLRRKNSTNVSTEIKSITASHQKANAVANDQKLTKQPSKNSDTLNAYVKTIDATTNIIVLNKEGEILYANKLFCQWLGIAQTKITGKKLSAIVQFDIKVDLIAKNSGSSKIELPFTTMHNAVKWGDVTFSDVTLESGEEEVLCIVHDITERKVKEEQLNLKFEELRKQKEYLSSSNSTKDKFFSIMAHDVKGPLNSLLSFTDLIAMHVDKLSRNEIQEMAGQLKMSVDGLYKLLENLLEWSRSQTGDIPLFFEHLPVSSLLTKTLNLVESIRENKQIEIELKVSGNVTIFADENSIYSVLRNLIGNALKFTYKKGKIVIEAIELDNVVHLAIHDNGVGMSKEVMDWVFRLDKKYTTPGTAKEAGTGMGLVLCKEFVEKNNGKIWVKSKQGKGSTFWVELPKGDFNLVKKSVATY